MRRAVVVVMFACGQIDPSTPPTNTTYTFAMSEMFWGDSSREYVPTYGAWKSFGLNLDGKVTDATSTDVCTIASNGIQGDGLDGIDNGLGEMLVPNLSDDSAASRDTQQQLAAGGWTVQIQVTGLSDLDDQTSTGLSARLFNSERYPSVSPPTFDESTDWPVEGAGDPFQSVTVEHGVVTARANTPIHLLLHAQGVPIPLVLHEAIVTFTHATREAAVDGTIAGVLDLQEFTSTMRQIAGRISPSLCGTAFDGLAAQFAAAADILKDGTNRPGVPCDGISVGFGFNAKLIANPTLVTEVMPLADPCAN